VIPVRLGRSEALNWSYAYYRMVLLGDTALRDAPGASHPVFWALASAAYTLGPRSKDY
jgi:hypothetical protein